MTNKAALAYPDDGEVVCHLFKARFGGVYYKIVVCGLKYKAEQYIKHELKADEVEWLRSYIANGDMIVRLGSKNKVIAREGFVLRMEFMYQLMTKRNKALADKQELKDKEKEGK